MGVFIGAKLPYILGTNIAGIVEEIGSAVTKYSIGQHIYGQGDLQRPLPDSTGLQEYAILRPDFSALVPEGLTDDQVVTLPVNATTSFSALFHKDWFGLAPPFPSLEQEHKNNYEDLKLVVIGAGATVAKLAIQFAKIRGVGTIIAVASLSNEAELREIGATHVVDRYSTNIVEEVQTLAGGPDSVTHVYDCVSWTYELAISMVSKTQESVVLTLHAGTNIDELLKKLGKEKCVVKGVNGSRNNFEGTVVGDLFWESLGQWVLEGKVRIQDFKVVEGLDEKRVNEVLDSYRDGKKVLQGVVHPGNAVVA